MHKIKSCSTFLLAREAVLLSHIHSPKGLLGKPYSTNTLFDPLSPSELPYFYVALIQQGAESIL